MSGAAKEIKEKGINVITSPLTDFTQDVLHDIDGFVTDVWDAASDIVTSIWQDIVEPAVEKVFWLLGYTDETIEYVQIVTVNLLQQQVDDTLTLALLRSIRNEEDLMDSLQVYNTTHYANSLNLYLKRGETDYIFGTPTISGAFRALDVDALQSVLDSIEGQSTNILTASLTFLSDEIYVKHYLQVNESYTEDTSYIYKAPDPVPWIYDGFIEELSGEFTVNLQRTINDTGSHNGTINDSGTHDGAADAAVLVDSTQAWTVDEWIGGTVTNTTDNGSSGTVISNTETEITATLTGGTENDWDVSDAYTLVRNDNDVAILEDTTQTWVVNEWVGATITNNTDGSSGTVTANTDTTITATLTGGDNDWDVGDAYTIDKYEVTTLGYLVPAIIFGMYYEATYQLTAFPTYTKYFTYEINEGTYPTLDSSSSNDDTAVEYTDAGMLPIVPLKKASAYINADVKSDVYLSCKKQLKTLNMDLDTLIDAVKTNETNEGDIQDAYIDFGLNVFSDSEPVKRALFYLFFIMYTNAEVNETKYLEDPENNFNFVKVIEESYNIVFKFNFISKTIVNGTIGDGRIDRAEIINTILPNDIEDGIQSYITAQMQFSATQYMELKIQSPFLLTNILTLSNTIKHHITELSTVATDQKNFNIPLPSSFVVSSIFNNYEIEQIIDESCHMTIYAAQQDHLEWYETPSFLQFLSFVIIVIAIIYIIFTYDPEGTITLLALAEAILYQYVIMLILKRAMEIYSDDERARILLTIGYVAASFYGPGGGSGLGTAEALLFAVNAAVSAISIELGIQSDLLSKEYDALYTSQEERTEELEKARALLDNSSGLNYWELITYFPTNPYEKPTDYYNRTTHVGNPGVLSLDQIEVFHDNLLLLPELDTHSFDPVSGYK